MHFVLFLVLFEIIMLQFGWLTRVSQGGNILVELPLELGLF